MWVHSPFPKPEEPVVFRFLNYYFKQECIDSVICTLWVGDGGSSGLGQRL